MSLDRYPYSPRNYGFSTSNEPAVNYNISIDTRRYPDMYYAYQAFAKKFNLKEDNFILANGGENAIKNTLLAIRPKSMYWTKPTWQMLEVFCEALRIKPVNDVFHFDPPFQTFVEDAPLNAEVFYSCNGKSSVLTYNTNYTDEEVFKNYKWVIIDVSYEDIYGIQEAIRKSKKFKNVIIVGSFDKLFGCGLRLGFSIFPDSLKRDMHLQREQYINPAAVNFLTQKDLMVPDLKYYNKLMEEEILDLSTCYCRNYIVFYGNFNTTLPNYRFEIDNYKFTRFGIPYTEEEYNNLVNTIKFGRE